MISGVVLAAGTSSRFGSTKQLTSFGGKPLAQHAIDALVDAGGFGEIVVVTGHDADAVESGLALPAAGRFVRNPAYREGQSASLAAAIHALDESSEAAVVLLADQPGIGPDVIRRMVDHFRETRRQIVRATYRDGPGPALLSREVYAEAGHLTGDVGARVLMASHPDWVAEVPVDTGRPPDVDTRDDLIP